MHGFEVYQKLGDIRDLEPKESREVYDALVQFGESNRFAIGLMLLAQLAVGVVRVAQHLRRCV
jgi:hypothetical protein